MENTIFTIGHSNLDIIEFIKLLSTNQIELVVDVRSAPYSKLYPHFNRNALEVSLMKNFIKYLFLCDSLGGRSNNVNDFSKGRIVYKKIAEKEEYKSSINKIILNSSKYKIALMCSEKEPLECHRTLLIARSIENQMVKVLHIQRDGQIESQIEAVQRLLKIWKLDTPNLFGDDVERIDEAFARQESKHAYFDENKII